MSCGFSSDERQRASWIREFPGLNHQLRFRDHSEADAARLAWASLPHIRHLRNHLVATRFHRFRRQIINKAQSRHEPAAIGYLNV